MRLAIMMATAKMRMMVACVSASRVEPDCSGLSPCIVTPKSQKKSQSTKYTKYEKSYLASGHDLLAPEERKLAGDPHLSCSTKSDGDNDDDDESLWWITGLEATHIDWHSLTVPCRLTADDGSGNQYCKLKEEKCKNNR